MIDNKVVKNASWIIGFQIVKVIIGILISMFTARFLGPSNYGLINYAASLVAFVTPIMYLGLNNVLVQEIVSNPEKEGETLGTAICLSVVSGILCICGIVCFTYIVDPTDTETMLVCFLYSFLLVFQGIDLVRYWFQAKLMSKYSALVSMIAYLIISFYKFILLITQKNIYWFAISQALDYLIISVALVYIYNKLGNSRFSFSWDAAKRMLNKSKYYIISNMMIVMFSQIDRIMLKLMISDEMTGYYTAAVTCATMVSFVFTAVIDSMRPVIFKSKEQNTNKYKDSVVTLYNIIIYVSLAYSVFVAIFAPLIINILYGEAYVSSIPILRIIIWYCMFSYIGGARDVWILAENKQKYLISINAVGAITNIVLNYLLIPIYQAEGAAIASLFTQIATNIVFANVYPPLRENGVLLLKAANPKVFINSIRSIVQK